MRQSGFLTMIGMVLALGLSACAGELVETPVIVEETPTAPLPEGSSVLPASRGLSLERGLEAATPTPNAQAALQAVSVRVWWPEELYPQDAGAAENVLLAQFEDFRLTYTSYVLEVRRKRTNGMGGILPTLRTASPVAPSAMPDLTLMRRADMVTAATEGLIVPLENWLPPDLMGDLLPGTRALGEIDGVLYGLPYTLNIYHNVYRISPSEQVPLTFAGVLEQQPVYLFPAGALSGNWTLLLQYRAAGGRLVDDSGSSVLDRPALVTVLDYYAKAVEAGIFDPSLLNYADVDGYWDSFVSTGIDMAAVDSATYLRRKSSLHNVGVTPIPTESGSPVTALDGWVWVLTTQDPDRQTRARAFLSWMMRISEQSLFSEAFGILPSQKRALRLWEDQDYAQFAQGLVAAAELIPDTQRTGGAAEALQTGLAAVLEGASAETAADAALGQLGQ
ncbi:MAG: extracellular solute-binding protein [Chloroflexi bacterium]|nr:extracellular solute-binding protein [Chloroflexota bacterium]